MKRILKLAALVPACSLAVSILRAGLVVNGGFETGDFTGWTQSGNTSETFVFGALPGLGAPHSGNYQAFLGAVGSLGMISQSLATVPGQTYQIEFWVSDAVAFSPSEFYARWGNSLLLDLVNPNKFPYTEYTFDMTASGSSTVLDFGFRQDASFFLLDDISVTPVPEPAGWGAGLIAGALAVFGAVRAPRRPPCARPARCT